MIDVKLEIGDVRIEIQDALEEGRTPRLCNCVDICYPYRGSACWRILTDSLLHKGRKND